ncbi:MAG: hypothetical protein J5525_12420 [Lachnospiraceae bacterium]|nr:hypothetical protein [Lachnospiraceae bacterium]
MADIELVIKINEEIYNHTQEYEVGGFNQENDTKLFVAIKNGTPLPKGHGRLGDLDALEKEIVNGIKAGNYEEGYETFAHINNMDDCVECVKYADTIIEAVPESEG